MAKPKVFIGVGHGGRDPGAVKGNKVERDTNLIIATEMKRVLNNNGIRAKRSRKSNDVEDSVQSEVIECNEYDPDITIEVHMNAGGGKGFEVWYTSERGKVLADVLVKRVKQNPKITNRGAKHSDWLYYLNHTKCPAVLCEGGFIDSPKGCDDWMFKEAGAKLLGVMYAESVIEYFKKIGRI